MMRNGIKVEEKGKLYFQNIAETISSVFRSLLTTEARPKKIFARRLASLPNDIIIKIDYSADLTGYFAYFISLKTAFAVCSKLVPGISQDFFDGEHLDILGEVGNMIAGNTIGRLQNISAEISLSPPELAGFHEILATERLHDFYSSNFEIEEGTMGVLLAIAKSK
ncbi:MAG: hypothetical protein EPN93_05575 [Spirochaetes bacterium]|nr:MAG: hypothetical protein EPN93_05575 [Spirochaetota bacterium]